MNEIHARADGSALTFAKPSPPVERKTSPPVERKPTTTSGGSLVIVMAADTVAIKTS